MVGPFFYVLIALNGSEKERLRLLYGRFLCGNPAQIRSSICTTDISTNGGNFGFIVKLNHIRYIQYFRLIDDNFQLTGNPTFDAIASIGIGIVLVLTAFVLALESKNLLIGESAMAGLTPT